jgi:uncharacterized protein
MNNFFAKAIKSLALFSFIFLVSSNRGISLTKVSAYAVSEYQGFVNDYADVISEETEQGLEEKLTTLAGEENGAEIAVVTIETLGDDYIEAVAQEFFDVWKVGKKDADNGVILLLAIKEREIRIHTGYGSEVFLTDAKSGRIIRDTIVPLLKEENYDQAISAGVDEIINASKNIDQVELSSGGISDSSSFSGLLSMASSILVFFLVGATYFTSFLGRSKSWWAGGVIGSVLGLVFVGFNSALVLGLTGLLFDYVLSKNYKKWKIEHKTTSWRKTMGGFRSGSSSSSSGMTFGGGRSGGGGASGKW